MKLLVHGKLCLHSSSSVMENKVRNCEGSLQRCFEQEDDNGDPGLEDANLQHLNAYIKMRTAEQQRNVLRMLEKSLTQEIDLGAKLNQLRQIEESLKLQLQQEVFCMQEEDEDTWQRLFEAENSAEILLAISKELFEQIQVENKSINGSKRVEKLQSKQNELGQAQEGSKLQRQREEEVEDMWQRLFEAENNTEVLLMISKELFLQTQSKDRSINEPNQRDDELQSKIQQLNEQLKEKACALQDSETSRNELSVKVSLLELKLGVSVLQLQQVNDSLEQNEEFKQKACTAENRASIAEAESKLLRESNSELHKEMSSLKSNIADASTRLERMGRLLNNSDKKRQHAKASAEAAQEKQRTLKCMIKDMNSLIRDLNLKVVKAEWQTESTEDKCIILSESNAELNEEINFLMHRVQNLEKSLQQANDSEKGIAKGIRVRTEMIADLVKQLALKRECLHNQISSLAKEKEVAVMYLQQMKEPSVTMAANKGARVDKSVLSEDDSKSGNFRNKSSKEIMGSSAASYEAGTMQGDMVSGENKKRITDSTSEPNTMRNTDARYLNFTYILLVLIVSVIAVVMVVLMYYQLVIGRP